MELFKVGDKVVCIDPGKAAPFILKVGSVHIISAIHIFGSTQKISITSDRRIGFKGSRFMSLKNYRKIKLENLKNEKDNM